MTDDLQITEQKADTSVHFLVLTDIHGNKTYATCITFYRPYIIEKVGLSSSQYLVEVILMKFGDLYCFCTVSSFSSLLPLYLSITFLRNDWTELYKTPVYRWWAYIYLVVHPILISFILGWSTIFLRGWMGVGSNIESYGKNITLYCEWL